MATISRVMGPLLANLVCALAALAAADLAVAAAHGYALRTDIAWLIAAQLLGLLMVALPGLVLLGAAQRVGAARRWARERPATAAIVAGGVPLCALGLASRSHGAAAPVLAAVAGLALLVWLSERKGRGGLRGATACLGFATAALLLALSFWSPSRLATLPKPSAAPRSQPTQPNLILIVLDTVRADHLGAYGYARDTTPWFDELARSSSLFEQAVASSSYTLPTHATLFTGLYPRAHGAEVSPNGAGVSLLELGLQADFVKVRPLSPEATTLAEILRERGFETGAICANTAYLARPFGLDQGFETYVDTVPQQAARRPIGLRIVRKLLSGRVAGIERLFTSNDRYYLLAPEVNDLALRWLAPRRDRPFFLFLNYMDPHAPYLPVGSFARLYRGETPPLRAEERPSPGNPPALPAGRYDADVNAYDAEIRYLDHHLHQLFDRLEAWGLLENTVLLIVGDHGESFGEHGRITHAVSVFETEVHVPLLLREPGQRAGRRATERVHQVDVFPTLLERLGFSVPSGLPGRSLLEPGGSRGVPIVTHLGAYERDFSETAVYDGVWKLLERSDGGASLFDLAADPAEAHDLAAGQPGVRARLTQELERFRTETPPLFLAPALDMDADTQERLKALGYAR